MPREAPEALVAWRRLKLGSPRSLERTVAS